MHTYYILELFFLLEKPFFSMLCQFCQLFAMEKKKPPSQRLPRSPPMADLPSLDDSFQYGVCCDSTPLNEMCTLFGFYCRFLAHGLAVALIVDSSFYHATKPMLAIFSLLVGAAMLLLESSYCCFHHRCAINRVTLMCDSYLLRAILYAVLCAGGLVRWKYDRGTMDLLVMYIMLGALSMFYAVAHWERPPSIYSFYVSEKEMKEARLKVLEEDARAVADGSDKSLLPGNSV